MKKLHYTGISKTLNFLAISFWMSIIIFVIFTLSTLLVAFKANFKFDKAAIATIIVYELSFAIRMIIWVVTHALGDTIITVYFELPNLFTSYIV